MTGDKILKCLREDVPRRARCPGCVALLCDISLEDARATLHVLATDNQVRLGPGTCDVCLRRLDDIACLT